MKNQFNYRYQRIRFRTLLACLILFSCADAVVAQPSVETGIKIFDNKNYYGAERFFTDFLKGNPDNAVAYYYLGRIAWVNKKNDDATDFFDKAIDLDNSNTWFYTWKGINYITILQQVDLIKQGFYAYKAMSALEKAVDLDSTNATARTYLAGYYSQAPVFAGGSEEKAILQINTAVALDSTDPGILLQRGIIMATYEKFDEAKKSLDRAMDINPEFYPAYFQMGRVSADGGVYLDQGETCLNRFIVSSPKEFDNDRDDAWWLLGNIYRKKGDNTKAKEAYEKALALNPDNENYRKSLKSVM